MNTMDQKMLKQLTPQSSMSVGQANIDDEKEYSFVNYTQSPPSSNSPEEQPSS
jgi:hypothetical protein